MNISFLNAINILKSTLAWLNPNFLSPRLPSNYINVSLSLSDKQQLGFSDRKLMSHLSLASVSQSTKSSTLKEEGIRIPIAFLLLATLVKPLSLPLWITAVASFFIAFHTSVLVPGMPRSQHSSKPTCFLNYSQLPLSLFRLYHSLSFYSESYPGP